ncbi:MAG: hypothetical protein EOP38_06135 [Rubrivivax sp.]|nr:MAG: hypothetical protein EOP38_06135 [Rubrivivax sp.]
MDLILLPDGGDKSLEHHYTNALIKAVELYIVSAYLTEWDAPAKLSDGCKKFLFIIGKDFGITRKEACRKVMRWLPKRFEGQFMAATGIDGFHPKAMFWREADGSLHALVGSSNLTRAAFSHNHEANVYFQVSKSQFDTARSWVEAMTTSCLAVSEGWLEIYREAPRGGPTGPSGKSSAEELRDALKLPQIAGAAEIVRKRRDQLASYEVHKAGLMRIFKACATGRKSNEDFYDSLPEHWSLELNNRLQGAGWERQGKASDFRELCRSFIRIVDAPAAKRDTVVAEEIDALREKGVRSRGAFLSEMLCLRFPDLYPVKNEPVEGFLAAIKFKGPRGASEGVAYVDLAQRLRMTLRANPKHPAKNIAELDAVLWLAYGKNSPGLE